MNQYDTDKDNALVLDNFLEFFRESSISKGNIVW